MDKAVPRVLRAVQPGAEDRAKPPERVSSPPRGEAVRKAARSRANPARAVPKVAGPTIACLKTWAMAAMTTSSLAS